MSTYPKKFIEDGKSTGKLLPHMDVLVRHKWPEEKPVELKPYLVRYQWDGGGFAQDVWSGVGWEYLSDGNVTHWWELPEVKE